MLGPQGGWWSCFGMTFRNASQARNRVIVWFGVNCDTDASPPLPKLLSILEGGKRKTFTQIYNCTSSSYFSVRNAIVE